MSSLASKLELGEPGGNVNRQLIVPWIINAVAELHVEQPGSPGVGSSSALPLGNLFVKG
jgi:hypothetical protein